MDNVFRTTEFWKSALMTMPDSSFYELVRSVFGKIKTPFSKQQLVSDLEEFLLRDDIQRAISSYIDENDRKVITAVAVLKEPEQVSLENFFTGEFSRAELGAIVVNLEERFVLYRFRKETEVARDWGNYSGGANSHNTRLALNPVIRSLLEPLIPSTSVLFPSVPVDEMTANVLPKGMVLNNRILAGLLSFVSEDEFFFKPENSLRKRIVDAGKLIFPGLELETTISALKALGLFYSEDLNLYPDYRRFADFSALTQRQRLIFCAAAILSSGEIRGEPLLQWGKIKNTAVFIHRLLNSLDEGFCYPEKTINRIAALIQREIDFNYDCGNISDALEKAGLVCHVMAQNSLMIKRCELPQAPTETDAPVIAADSEFSFLVYPEIEYSDAIELAQVTCIREAGAVVRVELTRDSVVRAFDRGIVAASIIDLLIRLSAGRISETLTWTILEWEKRYSEVSLRSGLVLTLSSERQYLAQTKNLSGLIRETLAPGIYIVSDNRREVIQALAQAGVDIVARGENRRNNKSGQNFFSSSLPLFDDPSGIMRENNSTGKSADQASSAELTEKLRAVLAQMQMGNAEKSELAARIDRKLVLCESQLTGASVRFEKLEARFLDYAGKLGIAKQAVAQQSPVEIHWPGEEKTGSKIFGVPKALEKEGNEMIIVIAPDESPSRESALRIPLGKVSLLRRIKKSIFETS